MAFGVGAAIIRDRDTMKQERIKIAELIDYLKKTYLNKYFYKMCKEIFTKNKQVLKILLTIILALAFIMLLFVRLSPKEFFYPKPTIKKNIVLGLSPEANAKEYLIQVDDNPSFESPESIKRISGRRSRIVIGVESENKSYYWRIKPVTENDDKNSWQNQGELKELLPAGDFEVLMDGEYYSTGKPINFYLFVRNRENSAKEFPYEISIESKEPAVESTARETHYILKGKIAVEANGYKLEKVEMIAEKNLEIGRVIYAVAKSGEQKAVETFEIVPPYGIKGIEEENINKGQTGKLRLVIENISANSINEFKAKLSVTSDKLKIKDWISEKKITNFEPNTIEILEWNVEASDIGYTQIVIEISSDGVLNKTGKVVQIGYTNSLALNTPDIETSPNIPAKLKVKVANLSSSPANATLEFSNDLLYYPDEGTGILGKDVQPYYPVTVDQKKKTVNLGPTSEECVRNFTGDCSAEIEWIVTVSEYGYFEYVIKTDGFEMNDFKGYITATEQGLKIDLLADGNENSSKKSITDDKKPVNFDVEVKNLSDKTDRIRVNIFPHEGIGWENYLYDVTNGEKRIDTVNYAVNIPPLSSNRYKIVLVPPPFTSDRYKDISFTNPLKVDIKAQSRIDYSVSKQVFVEVEFVK